MGRISMQQARGFAIFSAAFVLSGLSSAFAHMAQNTLALMTGLLALVLIMTMFTEAQKGR